MDNSKESRKALLDYIKKVMYKPDYPLLTTQIKRMMQDDKTMTYDSIRYTMEYIIEHQNLHLDTLGIVPYFHGEAMRYKAWLENIKKQVEEWQMEENAIVYHGGVDKEEVIFD